jgi:hypothetical protein
VNELQVRLLARERELDYREGTIVMWEEWMAAFECALGRACMERDAKRAEAEAVRQDYLARMRAFTANSKHTINISPMLEECQILFSL